MGGTAELPKAWEQQLHTLQAPDLSSTKTVIENWRVSYLAEFYLETDYQYVLLKFPLEIGKKKKGLFIDKIA